MSISILYFVIMWFYVGFINVDIIENISFNFRLLNQIKENERKCLFSLTHITPHKSQLDFNCLKTFELIIFYMQYMHYFLGLYIVYCANHHSHMQDSLGNPTQLYKHGDTFISFDPLVSVTFIVHLSVQHKWKTFEHLGETW